MSKQPRTVELAELQSAARLGGKTETVLSEAKFPKIKMVWVTGEGLLVNIKNQVTLIPSTNVKFAHFAPETVKET